MLEAVARHGDGNRPPWGWLFAASPVPAVQGWDLERATPVFVGVMVRRHLAFPSSGSI
jgi:hypothetical protein